MENKPVEIPKIEIPEKEIPEKGWAERIMWSIIWGKEEKPKHWQNLISNSNENARKNN